MLSYAGPNISGIRNRNSRIRSRNRTWSQPIYWMARAGAAISNAAAIAIALKTTQQPAKWAKKPSDHKSHARGSRPKPNYTRALAIYGCFCSSRGSHTWPPKTNWQPWKIYWPTRSVTCGDSAKWDTSIGEHSQSIIVLAAYRPYRCPLKTVFQIGHPRHFPFYLSQCSSCLNSCYTVKNIVNHYHIQ